MTSVMKNMKLTHRSKMKKSRHVVVYVCFGSHWLQLSGRCIACLTVKN
jgi:hypothetical protein